MIEIISSIYTFWGYIDDTNFLRKSFKVMSKWFSFLKWYWKNPEVQIKYSRLITSKYNKDSIEDIYSSLVNKNKKIGDGFTKSKEEMQFEIEDSKLNYRVKIDRLNQEKQNIIFENKYISFYPIRKFKSLNSITNEYNEIYEIISNPLVIENNNKVITVDVKEVDNSNKEHVKFLKSNAQISFKGNKIQIKNFNGTEQGEFLLFFIMKWLTEYKRN
ncbi:MAG: hypothetical protein AABW89_04900 [Nanoarchaeota archaeon]